MAKGWPGLMLRMAPSVKVMRKTCDGLRACCPPGRLAPQRSRPRRCCRRDPRHANRRSIGPPTVSRSAYLVRRRLDTEAVRNAMSPRHNGWGARSWFRTADPDSYTLCQLAGADSGSRRSVSRNPTRVDRSVGRAGIRSRPRSRYRSRAFRRRTSTATWDRCTSCHWPRARPGRLLVWAGSRKYRSTRRWTTPRSGRNRRRGTAAAGRRPSCSQLGRTSCHPAHVACRRYR